MMETIGNWLLWLADCVLARVAKKRYGGPGENGEHFNTACFHASVYYGCGEREARWLISVAGYKPGQGGCHWLPIESKKPRK